MADLWSSLLPAEASNYSGQVDLLTGLMLVLAVGLSAPVFILMAYFAVKYRRGKPANRTHAANRNVWLEISWSIIPFIALLGFYLWSADLFARLYHPPGNTLEIDLVAKQWMWKFQHPEGQGEINELHVPVDQPVKLVMASQDVIHSLYLPALRIKQDVVPGRYTSEWFTANRPGTYMLACAEYCGANHSEMGGRIIVLDKAGYARWLGQSSVDNSLVLAGAALFRTRGCSGCHESGATVHAPRLDGIYGRPVALQTGGTVIADDQYLRDSILLPQSQIAAGYPPIMPTFQNVLSEEDVLKIIAYIKSLPPEANTQ